MGVVGGSGVEATDRFRILPGSLLEELPFGIALFVDGGVGVPVPQGVGVKRLSAMRRPVAVTSCSLRQPISAAAVPRHDYGGCPPRTRSWLGWGRSARASRHRGGPHVETCRGCRRMMMSRIFVFFGTSSWGLFPYQPGAG